MRRPLKNQIFVRLTLLLLVTVAAVTYANIRSIYTENRARESKRLEQIGQLLASTRFPLTRTVLQSMSSLSGAEFQLVDDRMTLVSKTASAPDRVFPVTRDSVPFNGQIFLHSGIPLGHNAAVQSKPATMIHIYLPLRSDSAVWWQAAKSPLFIASISLPIALIISLALANRVTRPLSQLRTQVDQVAAGNLAEIETAGGSDEIVALNRSLNEMVLQLREHDERLVQNERLRTLFQIGNGLAHSLRNSATGCKMAIELLSGEQQALADNSNLIVARRQLEAMESTIQKFLSLSQNESQAQSTDVAPVDLVRILEKVIFQLTPQANHLQVQLRTETMGAQAKVAIRADDAEQMMINLVSNAIAAATETAPGSSNRQASVDVLLDAANPDKVVFLVADTGIGPPPDIQDDLFKPFVSGRPEGTGLGLSLVREIAGRVGGQIDWHRDQGKTVFRFEFSKPANGEQCS